MTPVRIERIPTPEASVFKMLTFTAGGGTSHPNILRAYAVFKSAHRHWSCRVVPCSALLKNSPSIPTYFQVILGPFLGKSAEMKRRPGKEEAAGNRAHPVLHPGDAAPRLQTSCSFQSRENLVKTKYAT